MHSSRLKFLVFLNALVAKSTEQFFENQIIDSRMNLVKMVEWQHEIWRMTTFIPSSAGPTALVVWFYIS